MRVAILATGILFLFSRVLCAGTVHVIGTENIAKLMAGSDLVCKGEVVEAPETVGSSAISLPRRTAIAIVRVDRCFKGQPPSNQFVPVLFDHILPSGGTSGGRIFVVFSKGEYCLYFLKAEGDKYVLVDDGTGRLPISRNIAADAGNESDPMQLLEMDLKAGLKDSDYDLVLDSIRLLGNMHHLQSEAELISLPDSQDMLVRTYVYQALLRLRDYSVLPAAEDWLLAQPAPPDAARMPTRSLDRMQYWLVSEIAAIRDPAYLPAMERLLNLPCNSMRRDILQGMRAIRAQQSAPTFLRMLDDPDPEIDFIAMQSLFELAGGGPIDWVPSSFDDLRLNRAYYSARCREWWQAKHPQE